MTDRLEIDTWVFWTANSKLMVPGSADGTREGTEVERELASRPTRGPWLN